MGRQNPRMLPCQRCRRAGVLDARAFVTKPALARQMLERTRTAGVAMAWITGDSIYGDGRTLRPYLEAHCQAYVLAVSGKESAWLQHRQRQISTLLADLPTEGWEQLRAGMSSKGLRWYNWLRLDASAPAQRGWKRWVLLRRSITDPMEKAAYIAYARATTGLAEMVRVAGMRWTVEETLQTAKGEVGLDHYEVRSWAGWYRHMTLAMWAQAFLTVVRAEMGTDVALKKGAQGLLRTSLARFKAHRGLQAS